MPKLSAPSQPSEQTPARKPVTINPVSILNVLNDIPRPPALPYISLRSKDKFEIARAIERAFTIGVGHGIAMGRLKDLKYAKVMGPGLGNSKILAPAFIAEIVNDIRAKNVERATSRFRISDISKLGSDYQHLISLLQGKEVQVIQDCNDADSIYLVASDIENKMAVYQMTPELGQSLRDISEAVDMVQHQDKSTSNKRRINFLDRDHLGLMNNNGTRGLALLSATTENMVIQINPNSQGAADILVGKRLGGRRYSFLGEISTSFINTEILEVSSKELIAGVLTHLLSINEGDEERKFTELDAKLLLLTKYTNSYTYHLAAAIKTHLREHSLLSPDTKKYLDSLAYCGDEALVGSPLLRILPVEDAKLDRNKFIAVSEHVDPVQLLAAINSEMAAG